MADRAATERKCPKCGGGVFRIPLSPVQFGDPSHPQAERTIRFKCQVCGLELTAAELHGDFWGHVHAFINEADKECSRMFKAGELGEFEKAWLDLENGIVARLEVYPWFADAKPVAKRIGSKAIRDFLQNTVDYYKEAFTILSGEPA